MNAEHLSRINQNETFDVIVVGGGINGIGTYRELALQGIKVLLVERNDFCSGASSAPSRMIHGGLRYLENAEFDLVKESLEERNRLLRNAPHLVKPLRTMVPIGSFFAGIKTASLRFFGFEQKTNDRGAFIVKAGLMFYDLFTRNDRALPTHEFYGRQAARTILPSLRDTVKCMAQYFDAWITSPERLALELISEANNIQSAQYAINHCELEIMNSEEIQLSSQLDGSHRIVNAKVIVNATGAWVDETNESFGEKSKFVTGTKGSHIIVNNKALHDELDGGMLYYENAENRVCILFPYMGNVLIGSTDIPVMSASNAICTDEEVDYILDSLSYILPKIEVTKDQIVYKFSGVRPLGAASKETAGQIPRSHKLHQTVTSGRDVLSLVGGKWTTFRAFAEQATDEVLLKLNRKRLRSTEDRVIGGGIGFPKNTNAKLEVISRLSSEYEIDAKAVAALFDRYGTACTHILEKNQSAELTPLLSLADYYCEEIDYLCGEEQAYALDDLLIRRTNLAIEGRLCNEVLVEVAIHMQGYLNWSIDHTVEQLEACTNKLITQHGCKLELSVLLEQYRSLVLKGENKCS